MRKWAEETAQEAEQDFDGKFGDDARFSEQAEKSDRSVSGESCVSCWPRVSLRAGGAGKKSLGDQSP